MPLLLEILPRLAAQWGGGASILVAARAATLLVQECLCDKETPSWSGTMVLRRLWLPSPLPLHCHPPPPPLTLPSPCPAGSRWHSVDDRPLLSSRQAACISPHCWCHCVPVATSSAVLSSAVRFKEQLQWNTTRTSNEIGNGSGSRDGGDEDDSRQERQMASMGAERGRLWMEHNNHSVV